MKRLWRTGIGGAGLVFAGLLLAPSMLAQKPAEEEKSPPAVKTTPLVKPKVPVTTVPRTAPLTKVPEKVPTTTAPQKLPTLKPGFAGKVTIEPAGSDALKRRIGVAGGLSYSDVLKARQAAEAAARNSSRGGRSGGAGVVIAGPDCDDFNASVHPGQVEVCNLRDDDCNGSVDEGVTLTVYQDADGDGFGDPAHPVQVCPIGDALADMSTRPTDCDDSDAARNPAMGTCS